MSDNSEVPIEQTLIYTQNLRKQLVKKIVRNEQDVSIPESNIEANLLPKLLDGMDRVALTQMKIKSEEKRDSEGAKALVSAFLSSINANDLALKPTSVTDSDITMPDDLSKEHNKVTDDRQLSIGTQHDNIDAFNERMGIE